MKYQRGDIGFPTLGFHFPFLPRPAKKKQKGFSNKSSKGRRSKESLKVGNAGEIAVLNYEKEKLQNAGLSSLASKVVHESAVV